MIFKSKKFWIFIILVAGLVWLFRQDLGLESKEYSYQMVPIPAPNYSAVAQGKIDIEGGVIEISARQGGTYREVLVKEGDIVEQGQVLAVQEDDEERIGLKTAQASLKSSKAQLKSQQLNLRIKQRELARLKPLVEVDASSQLELDRANDDIESLKIQLEQQNAAIEQAEASLDSAKFRLDQRTIRAPRAGRIIEVKARPGMGASTLNVSTAFTLMPDAQKIVRTDLSQEFVGKVTVGQQATIIPNSDKTAAYSGKVIRVGEIFGRKSSSGSQGVGGGTGNDSMIEVVVAAGNIPLLIGQKVLVRFEKLSAEKALGAVADQGGKNDSSKSY
ncbi:HlyD family secretion protein [Parashewanella curva]|nr:HlyD family efflux transporter periplasmic adaptor subunit [Parashewanella curva]